MGLNGKIDTFQYINAINDDRNIGQLGQCCAHIKKNIYDKWDCNLVGKFENMPFKALKMMFWHRKNSFFAGPSINGVNGSHEKLSYFAYVANFVFPFKFQ
jgi:hypothetical protein